MVSNAPLGNHRRAGHIHTKAFSERFGFDVLESRKFKLSVKNKATGTPLEVLLLYPSTWWAMIYTSAWGFQRCSVRQIGRCESLNTWDRAQNWLHVFRVYAIEPITVNVYDYRRE